MFNAKQEVLTRGFRAAGFDDVEFGEVITARRDGDAVWDVTLDRSGQLLIVITAPSGRQSEKSAQILGRPALLLIEKSTTSTLRFKLVDDSELERALKDLEAIIG
jgi:hypothetical protein